MASPPKTGKTAPAPTTRPTTSTSTTNEAFDPDLPQPCKSHDACAPGDLDRDGIRDAWEDTLALRFAPELRLPPSSKDWTRPASVDWYLARVHMRFENKGACNRDVQVLGVGKVTQSNIAGQMRRDKNLTRFGCREKGTLRRSNESIRFFLQPPDDRVHAGAPRSQWRTYVHVKRSSTTSGGYDVQYWFFYPFNDSVGPFNHEGDWEHITVTTDGQGDFVEAFYAQHEHGKTYARSQLQFVRGTHPVVYVADGSHASYPKRGSFDIPNVPKFDDHTYDGGPVWQTWSTLIHVGEKNRPRAKQYFLRYGGRWGEVGASQLGPLKHTSGPRGPAFQDAWNGR